MDLKSYYQKIRDVAATIAESFPIVVSLETSDGGKEGTRTEVPRGIAAKMIVEGRARLATAEEAQAFQEAQAEAKRAADQLAAASRLQVTVVSQEEMKRWRGQE